MPDDHRDGIVLVARAGQVGILQLPDRSLSE